MKKQLLFGEWLTQAEEGTQLRLVIEEMSEQSSQPSVFNALLITEPSLTCDICFTSGSSEFPWIGDKRDLQPSITWTFRGPVSFLSLRVQQTSDVEWIRRYRIEVSDDGHYWRVATPSRLIDSYHRQPCRLRNQVECLESDLLPSTCGTFWVKSLFEDYLLKTIEVLGPESPYPDCLSGEYFLAAAVRPFGFGGVYNSGDAGNFDALITAICSPEMAIEGQRLFPDLINRFGFMPSVMNPGHKDDKAFGLDISGTTWGPCCYWDTFAWSRDLDYLSWFTDACSTWARWWLENRDRNGDGWIEPGVNAWHPSSQEFRERGAQGNPQLAALCPEFWDYLGVHDTEHSAFWHMVCEMPWDDNPIFVQGRHRGLCFNPETGSTNIHFIESQLYISLLCRFVASACHKLGDADHAEYFAEQGQRLAGLVKDNCWDDETGFYHDRDIETGKRRTFVKHVGAFVAMMMGLPTQDQARRMVDHLLNPQEFWTPYPVPTISRDSPDYSPFSYWSGKAWPPTNFFVLRALLNYGFFDVADELLRRWLHHAQSCVHRPVQYFDMTTWEGAGPHDLRFAHVPDVQWIVPENWNPETGAVHASGGLTWGALWLPALIMRHFWPVGDHSVLIRPGGHFQLQWGKRWSVLIDDQRATINGRSIRLSESATFLLDENTGVCRVLASGVADPVLLSL